VLPNHLGEDNAMDRDICDLTLLYLLKAREYAISGQVHKAHIQLGLSKDATDVLGHLPLVKLIALAHSSGIDFVHRAPPQFWKDLLEEEPTQAFAESLMMHLLVTCTRERNHDDLAASA
jgi:hypothetical protein